MDGPKLRPETSASIGMDESGWNERCLYYWGSLACSSWGDPTLGTSPVFVVRVSRKSSPTEDSECSCLSYHSSIAGSLGPYLWVV